MAKKKEPSMIFGPDELSELIPDLLLLEAWSKSLRQLIADRLLLGHKVPGARLEPTFSPRAWDDEGLDVEEMTKVLQKTLKKLGLASDLDTVAPRKVLSPAQAEKLTGKPLFKEHLSAYADIKPTGNHTLKFDKPRASNPSKS